jgi:hypothetical protein
MTTNATAASAEAWLDKYADVFMKTYIRGPKRHFVDKAHGLASTDSYILHVIVGPASKPIYYFMADHPDAEAFPDVCLEVNGTTVRGLKNVLALAKGMHAECSPQGRKGALILFSMPVGEDDTVMCKPVLWMD